MSDKLKIAILSLNDRQLQHFVKELTLRYLDLDFVGEEEEKAIAGNIKAIATI